MLEVLGLQSVEDLFAHIPAPIRRQADLLLPSGLSEFQVQEALFRLAARNAPTRGVLAFLGAGAYPHFVPAVVDQTLQRVEFTTAYTPYQPEVSQGTLQATFEFQSLVALLLGLDVANASMYDGASATAEAVLMAKRILPKRSTVLVSQALHPQYRQVIHTYVDGLEGVRLVELPYSPDGRTDAQALEQTLSEDTICVVIGYPNFFGVVEDLKPIWTLTHGCGALAISATTEAIALGLLKSPGELGCDIAVAEGQSLGLPLSYGGPGLGLFASRERFLRNLPGRLVGQTVDGEGRRGFVLTLATREQHIRRERATSNICTNHGLCALAATVFLCLMGKEGLRKLAELNYKKAHYASTLLAHSAGCRLRFAAPFFNEFVLEVPHARQIREKLQEQKLIAGVLLEEWYPEIADSLLLCVTEVHKREEIERLVQAIKEMQALGA
jgi:glycine dehydrogenase subunit 1